MNDVNTPPLRSIDLCGGGGGAGLGIHLAGFNTILSIDMDKNATDCYKMNFPECIVLTKKMEEVSVTEILKLTNLKVGELDHIHCSWPCKEFSIANTKIAKNPPANINRLFFEYLEKIKQLQPKAWSGENVGGMLFGAKKKHFADAVNAINALGNYEFKYKIMNCAFYGVPQNRSRLLIMAKRRDIAPGVELEFPEPNYFIDELRVKSILPGVKFYRQNQFAKEIIHNSHLMCTVTATDSILVFDTDWRKISIEELKKVMSFPQSFILPSKSRTVNVRILGNAVPPLMMKAVMEKIKQTILK